MLRAKGRHEWRVYLCAMASASVGVTWEGADGSPGSSALTPEPFPPLIGELHPVAKPNTARLSNAMTRDMVAGEGVGACGSEADAVYIARLWE
jgi:hypothetical protein